MLYCSKYPFLSEYFEKGIKNPNRAISHSILFYGNDIRAQYNFAYEIARLLNCKEDKSDDCHCLNCNWIRDRQHPAVLTISKVDNKLSDDESKTVISVKQAQMVKKGLVNTSDFHRVFIFCDRDIDGEPLGLNHLNFQEETANSLLKVIEEPPENTTFFFLTRDKNDLISTIISRSQCFFVPSMTGEEHDFSVVEEAIDQYWEIERKEAFEVAQRLYLLSKIEDTIKIFEGLQSYMLETAKSNIDNRSLKLRLIKDIEAVELAKKQFAAKLNLQSVFENMCLEIIK